MSSTTCRCDGLKPVSPLAEVSRGRRIDPLVRVPARAAHDLAEHRRQARAATVLAPVEALGPSRLVALTLGTDQDLPAAGHRADPRRAPLVRVVGGAAADHAAGLRADGVAARAHDSGRYSPVRCRSG